MIWFRESVDGPWHYVTKKGQRLKGQLLTTPRPPTPTSADLGKIVHTRTQLAWSGARLRLIDARLKAIILSLKMVKSEEGRPKGQCIFNSPTHPGYAHRSKAVEALPQTATAERPLCPRPTWPPSPTTFSMKGRAFPSMKASEGHTAEAKEEPFVKFVHPVTQLLTLA